MVLMMDIWTVFANLGFVLTLVVYAALIGHEIKDLLTRRSRKDR